MRIAVLSDIHGNPVALDAVLGDIQAQGGVDATWILGDLAAIGHDPVGTLERLADLPQATFVRGNTDRYLVTGERPPPSVQQCERNPALWPTRVEVASSMSWTQGMVTQAGWREWLADLPLEHRATLPDGSQVLCVHASPGRDDGPGLQPGMSGEALDSLAAAADADLLLVGHTHCQVDVTVGGVRMVNSGSVSNVFPPDLRASYLLLEAGEDTFTAQHRRVDYDREAVIREVKRVKHPAAGFIVHFMRGEIRM